MLFHSVRRIWRPAMYQGQARMRGYFEGWYYKFADASERHVGAFIPGVSFDRDGDHPHCFIQFLDDSGVMSHYYQYDIGAFSFSRDISEIRIADSVFSPTRIEINVNADANSISGELSFKETTPWPVTLLSPGAMGWYAFVPFMECYHGVLSFDHLIEGRIELNGNPIDLTGGRGYTEKDWGKSFPSYHIWVQTNHFEKPGTSLMVSIANIPWLRRSFDGFLIALWHNGHLHRFTTYTGARITTFRYEQQTLVVHVESKRRRLEIEVSRKRGTELRSPVVGEMQGRLSESLAAETRVRLYERAKDQESLAFDGLGRHTGLEIEGRIPEKLSQ